MSKSISQLRGNQMISEAKEPASPDEKDMALRQANFILDFAEDLVEHLEDDGDFPEWMQNKLSAIHEKAKDLYASIEGSEDDEDEDDEVNEAVKFTDKQIKMAYGVANDKRYKGGNYSGAVRAIEKIAKGLSDHPDVKKVLKRTNESTAAYGKSQEKIANDKKKANIKPGELNKLAKIRAMLDKEKK